MATEATSGGWNLKALSAALLVLLAYAALVPDLTREATAKSGFALLLVLLLAGRMLVASLRKEAGRGWLFYFWITLCAPLWIEAGAYLAFGN